MNLEQIKLSISNQFKENKPIKYFLLKKGAELSWNTPLYHSEKIIGIEFGACRLQVKDFCLDDKDYTLEFLSYQVGEPIEDGYLWLNEGISVRGFVRQVIAVHEHVITFNLEMVSIKGQNYEYTLEYDSTIFSLTYAYREGKFGDALQYVEGIIDSYGKKTKTQLAACKWIPLEGLRDVIDTLSREDKKNPIKSDMKDALKWALSDYPLDNDYCHMVEIIRRLCVCQKNRKNKTK